MTRESTSTAPPVADLAAEVLYTPTEAQKRLKARFLAKTSGNPLYSGHLDLATVRQVLGTESLNQVWTKPGFQDWFLNTDEHREKLELIFADSLDALHSLIKNEDPKAQGARVNAIKVAAELASKFPRQQVDSGTALAATVGQMDKAQLELLLQKNGVNLRLSASRGSIDTAIDATPESEPK